MFPSEDEPAWYCVQTAPKQENKVAQLLQRGAAVEVYSPRLRFRRARRGEPIWWTEALFPGYVFARFDFFRQHRQIRAFPGVSTIVQFGEKPTKLDDEILAKLRETVGPDDLVEIGSFPEPAAEVLVIAGPLRGLRLLVTRVMPARARVAVLFEILGEEREIELDAYSTIPAAPRIPPVASRIHRD